MKKKKKKKKEKSTSCLRTMTMASRSQYTLGNKDVTILLSMSVFHLKVWSKTKSLYPFVQPRLSPTEERSWTPQVGREGGGEAELFIVKSGT